MVDGTTLVEIKHLTFTATDGTNGEHLSGTIDGNCVQLSDRAKQCSEQALNDAVGPFGDVIDAPGVVTTKDAAGWHVDPEQTLLQSLRISTAKLSDNQFNRTVGAYFHVLQVAQNLTPDATLSGNSVTVKLRADSTAVVGLQVKAGQKVTLMAKTARDDDVVGMTVATPDGWADDGSFGSFAYAGSYEDSGEGYGGVPTDATAYPSGYPTDDAPSGSATGLGSGSSTDFPTDFSTDGSEDYSALSGPDMDDDGMQTVTFTPKKSGTAKIIVLGTAGASVTISRS
ncbi:hypothetical protein [Flexivirga caeni]|uniref:Uncharacterized protein n=1 Tax=Flexivirga caeni TaxID=2294115 RepID=A0A3M9MEG0_9MICO|nr:hypothetical protein [Flexivirga caeni]RNI23939.1 hypothetical protein EFY87_06650 [Flexivirga caeni]